jgi:SnoaL-like domain
VLADWAYHLDHCELDELAELFTDDALFTASSPSSATRPAPPSAT